MTRDEFDKALTGRVRSHYSDSGKPSDLLEFKQEGWLQLLCDAAADMLALGWDGYVAQIKEKFGGLRFYIDQPICQACGGTGKVSGFGDREVKCRECDGTNVIAIYHRANKAESDSLGVCMDCGSTEDVTSGPLPGGYWILVLCHECRQGSIAP